MNWKKIGIAIAVLGLFAAYLYATPYITLFMLKRAIEAKSAKEVEKFIDFADVRDSLRSQLADYLQDQVAKDPDAAGFEGLAAGFGTALGGTMIDTLVSPGNLRKWLEGQQVSEPQKIYSIPSVTDLIETKNPTMNYMAFDIFEVGSSGQELVKAILLERRNLFSWKVRELTIDMAKFAESNDSSQLSTKSQSKGKAGLRALVSYTSGTGDGIIEVNQATKDYYYYCMGLDCPSSEPIHGGKVRVVSPDVVEISGSYYCKGDLPSQTISWKCTSSGYQPF